MTNGEKIIVLTGREPFIDNFGNPYMIFTKDWWNEEYKEPNIKIVADVIQHGKIGETPVCITCQHRQTCGTYWNDGLGMNPLMPSIRICRNYVKDESEVDT